MIGRRLTIAATAAATATAIATAAIPRRARAATTTIRWANASGFASPQLANDTVGMHPSLGFYAQEGIDLQVLNMQGSATTIQNVVARNCEIASLSPVSYLPLLAQNPRVDLTVPYVWLRPIHTQIFVLPTSPAKTIADLKGRTIGFINAADTANLMARRMLTDQGIDPENDITWTAVGPGIPAARALKSGQIDAYAAADTVAAQLETAGFAFRPLPNIGLVSKLFGLAWGARRSALADPTERKTYAGLFRAMTKSTIFTYTNPRAATHLHFDLYPEAVPKGIPLDQAIEEAQHVLQARKEKWLPGPADPRFGGQTPEDWRAWAEFTQTTGKLPDPAAIYTTALLDEANAFDQDAIRKLAAQA